MLIYVLFGFKLLSSYFILSSSMEMMSWFLNSSNYPYISVILLWALCKKNSRE